MTTYIIAQNIKSIQYVIRITAHSLCSLETQRTQREIWFSIAAERAAIDKDQPLYGDTLADAFKDLRLHCHIYLSRRDVLFLFSALSAENKKNNQTLRPLRLCGEILPNNYIVYVLGVLMLCIIPIVLPTIRSNEQYSKLSHETLLFPHTYPAPARPHCRFPQKHSLSQ